MYTPQELSEKNDNVTYMKCDVAHEQFVGLVIAGEIFEKENMSGIKVIISTLKNKVVGLLAERFMFHG